MPPKTTGSDSARRREDTRKRDERRGGARSGRGRSLVGRGVPSYRPVRSPLVSMGPSLSEVRRRRQDLRRIALIVAVSIVACVAIVELAIVLGSEVVGPPGVSRAPSHTVVATGRPEPMSLATVPSTTPDTPGIKLQLPINRHAITGIGYVQLHDTAAMELRPEGRRANLSFGEREAQRFLATKQPTGLRYYTLAGSGESRLALVGAPIGAEVYAPLSGTITAIADNVINGQAVGVVLQIQPLGDPETVVVLRSMDVAPGVAVGQTVAAGATLLGHVRSLADVQLEPLASYTHDRGVALELFVRRIQSDQLHP